MLIRRPVLWFLLSVLLSLAHLIPAAAQTLEIIQLRNRPAEQIVPIVQPMLDPGGAVSGSGFQLIVRTTPSNLAQIRQVVASLDRAARQLVIHVRQDAESRDSRFAAGAGVALEPGNSRVGGSIVDSNAQGRDNLSQQIRTQEGSAAYIRTGTSQLVPSRTVTRTVNGVVVQDTVTPRDIMSGFYATPRVNGDTVFLDIATQRDTPANLGPGSANVNRAMTTVSGRLGQWIEVGGSNQTRASESSGILARSSEAGALDRRIYLRVEEVR
jgi:type II secretory pathway component GspD/PulD (secretin)